MSGVFVDVPYRDNENDLNGVLIHKNDSSSRDPNYRLSSENESSSQSGDGHDSTEESEVEFQESEVELQELTGGAIFGISPPSPLPLTPEQKMDQIGQKVDDLNEEIEKAMERVTIATSTKTTNMGIIDDTKPFKSYYRMIFFAVILMHIGFILVTVFQLIFPTIDVVHSLALDVVFFAIIIIIMIISEMFSSTKSTFGIILSWIFTILIVITFMVTVFFQSTEIHFWTMFVVHLIVNVPTLTILIIEYSGKHKFQEIRIVSQKWTMIIIGGLFILLQRPILDFSPSIRVIPGIIIFILIFPMYLNSVVEINEGITGTFDKKVIIEPFTVLALTTALAYIAIMGSFGTVKVEGLDIYIFNPFTSSLWSALTLPSGWFGFL